MSKESRREYRAYVIKGYFPTTHAVHACEPVVFFHVPAAHSVHVLPSGPVLPTLHVQAATAEL